MVENITLTDPIENASDCGPALGEFISAWDQMHHATLELLAALLSLHTKAAYIVLASGLPQPALREILECAGNLRLSEADQKRFCKLLERWKTASSIRNRIVHGVWQLNVQITKEVNANGIRRTKARFIRYYPPTDITVIDVTSKMSQKARSRHYFEIAEIDAAAASVKTLARDFDAFIKTAPMQPFADSSPIEFQQRGAPLPPKTT